MANGSRKHLRVLHTSDLHLTSLGNRECQSLEALVASAIETIKREAYGYRNMDNFRMRILATNPDFKSDFHTY